MIMPSIKSNASDKEIDSIAQKVIDSNPAITITTDPVVITSVQRKVFIGNYETVDVFMGLALPTSVSDLTDKEALRKALVEAAELGFSITARETASRYRIIKEASQG
jgi:hypothetical protein